MDTPKPIDVYLEIGSKKTFACATDWPGWCRLGGDEALAMQALLDYAPRYAEVVRAEGMDLHIPAGLEELNVVERLEGNASTDFGAPDAVPSVDLQPLVEEDFQRFQRVLQACWRAFDKAVVDAGGKALRLGPRGGGRDLERIIRHVLGADQGYLSRLAWKVKAGQADSTQEELERTRRSILEALESAMRNGLPERGPRGGKLWSPRYMVRRSAWHVLDHAWEIEDRIL